MHGTDQPFTRVFCDGKAHVNRVRELFPSLFARDISGRHQPTHVRADCRYFELVFVLLFSLVETLEEVLISNFDFVRTRPDLPGTGSHDSGLFGQACHNPIEVVVSEGFIMRL